MDKNRERNPMEESIINLHGRGGWEEEKDSVMQFPSRYTSGQQGASRQLGCELCDMPRVDPPASFRMFPEDPPTLSV